ncbi:hypothetical protein [Geodermatophilus amargosae]|uniref:hypothetical protein n=1 Tax=Geodermatophilus amargosae TaxID=1296565 RepID=UPI0034E00880
MSKVRSQKTSVAKVHPSAETAACALVAVDGSDVARQAVVARIVRKPQRRTWRARVLDR